MARVLRMDKLEVLAHIAAPSDFKHDNRYRAQAEAVAQFEACSRLEIYSPGDCAPEVVTEEASSSSGATETSTFNTCLSFSAWRQTDLLQKTPAQNAMRQSLEQNPGHEVQESSVGKGSIAAHEAKDSSRPISWRITKSQGADHNAPYKIPSCQASSVQAARSPELARPQTAPPDSIAPKTANSRKRSRSEASSFDSLRSVVPDSQEEWTSFASRGCPSREVDVAVHSKYLAEPQSQTAVSQQPIKLRTRPAKQRRTEASVDWSHSSETTNLARLLGRGPPVLLSPAQNCRVSNDSSQRATTSSDSKSCWPLKPRPMMSYPVPPEQAPPVINRIPTFLAIPAPPPAANAHHSWLFTSSPSPSSLDQSLKPHPYTQPLPLPFPTISSLPTALHAPAPPAAHAHYTTHLTPSLRTLSTKLPLATSFRPILVKRDINVLERGHWYLRIRVAANPLPEAEGKLPDDCGSIRSKRRGNPWTEEAFLEFWHALADNIRRGWSGWGVGVYRDDPHSTFPSPTGSALDQRVSGEGRTRDVILKVTCWGETIPYIYILMWVLSDKRTGGLEMEWRDAGGEVVVRMGRREGGGGGGGGGTGEGLGVYGFKGGEGKEARWGILSEKG